MFSNSSSLKGGRGWKLTSNNTFRLQFLTPCRSYLQASLKFYRLQRRSRTLSAIKLWQVGYYRPKASTASPHATRVVEVLFPVFWYQNWWTWSNFSVGCARSPTCHHSSVQVFTLLLSSLRNLLFSMMKIGGHYRSPRRWTLTTGEKFYPLSWTKLVDQTGIKPATLSLQRICSINWATGPESGGAGGTRTHGVFIAS